MRVPSILAFGVVLMALGGCIVRPISIPGEQSLHQRLAASASGPVTVADTAAVAGADSFSREARVRCLAPQEDVPLSSAIPYRGNTFRLQRMTPGDPPPRFGVTGFSFAGWPADTVFRRLLEEAEITVLANEAPYPAISGEDLQGDLAEVMERIASQAGVFVTYDAVARRVDLSKSAWWRLDLPRSRPLMLAALDAMRGLGLREVISYWDAYALEFEGSRAMAEQVRDLMAYFDGQAAVVAYEIQLYRVGAKGNYGTVPWQDLFRRFGEDVVTLSAKGTRGRLLVTEPGFSDADLRRFLDDYAIRARLAGGMFAVPDRWDARFEIGRCGSPNVGEADLAFRVQPTVLEGEVISALTVESSQGVIGSYRVKGPVGSNLLLIGIPSTAIGPGASRTEVVAHFSPRVIRTVNLDGRQGPLAAAPP